MNETTNDLITGQYKTMEVWQKELQRRFDSNLLTTPITEILIQ
jgi:hypothetical protein